MALSGDHSGTQTSSSASSTTTTSSTQTSTSTNGTNGTNGRSRGLDRKLRTTDGYDQQLRLLTPGDDGPRFRLDADKRFGSMKRNLEAELTAERLATVRDLPKRDAGPKRAGGLDVAALVARWKAQGMTMPDLGKHDEEPSGDAQSQGREKKKGDPGALWGELVQSGPTISIDSKRGHHAAPLEQAKDAPIGEVLERVARAMKRDDQKVRVGGGRGWQADLDQEDPQWWVSLLAAMGGAFAYAVYDYIAFNELAFNQGDGKQLQYRLFQAPTQVFIHQWLASNVSSAAAGAFETLWWTWGCDLMFYAIAELGIGKADWHGPGSWETVSRAGITWASWTPLGILAGIGNLMNGKKWSEPIEGGALILQSLIGFLVAAGITFMSREDQDEFLDLIGLGWLAGLFAKHGMDLYVELTTSLEHPSVEAGLTFKPDENVEMKAGLGQDEDGFYGTLGMKVLGEHRDWLLDVGLTLDKSNIGAYAEWQKKVGEWNLFVSTRLRDEYLKIGGGAELRKDGVRLGGKMSWDTREKWLASLRISVDL
ncbi:MAG: hypothetical protein U1F43_20840 [Myxococcota bacterium]